jgi:hypothetical protein
MLSIITWSHVPTLLLLLLLQRPQLAAVAPYICFERSPPEVEVQCGISSILSAPAAAAAAAAVQSIA